MAEGVLAFGLAANAIQFIDFGGRVLSKSYKLYRSKSHEVEDSGLEIVTRDLQRVAECLHSSIRQDPERLRQPLSQNDIHLQELANRCWDTCRGLLAALDALKTGAQHGKWKTFRAALKAVWTEDEIELLQRKLDAYRQELIINILLALRCV